MKLNKRIIYLLASACLSIFPIPSYAKTDSSTVNTIPLGLRKFLQTTFIDSVVGKDLSIKVAVMRMQVEGQKDPTFIIYGTGRLLCGSGGCDLMIVRQKGVNYSIVSEIPAVQWPCCKVLSWL